MGGGRGRDSLRGRQCTLLSSSRLLPPLSPLLLPLSGPLAGMPGDPSALPSSPRELFSRRKPGAGGGADGGGGSNFQAIAKDWRSLINLPAWRVMLGRAALLNLLKTNPDIVPAAIEQVMGGGMRGRGLGKRGSIGV